jgi:hypothetical protein
VSAHAAERARLKQKIAALIVIARDVSWLLGVGVLLAAVMLLTQGANRLGLSTAVLQQAVVSSVIDDQFGAKVKEVVEANKNMRRATAVQHGNTAAAAAEQVEG